MLAGQSPAVGLTGEVNRRRTVPFALMGGQAVLPTAIVPPEGFETKIKQLSPQPVRLRQKISAVKKPRREALVAPRELHMRRMERSQCRDYGEGNKCSQATGSSRAERHEGKHEWLPRNAKRGTESSSPFAYSVARQRGYKHRWR